MAQNDMELENEGAAGKFERFLFLMIPILFTLVLIGVLLALFNMDYRNDMLKLANKIPIVEKWIPDPETTEADNADSKDKQTESSSSTIKKLKSQLAEQEAKVKELTEQKTAQDQQVKSLQDQIKSLQTAQDASAPTPSPTEDPHAKAVADMTKLYAGMKPSSAANIMKNMTTDEVVQLLSGMNNENKLAILEKMDPKTAADVSVKLKESTDSSDMAIAALQSRLNQQSSASTGSTSSGNLDKATLTQTFTSMPATEAAKLLSSMYSVSPDKVVTILSSVSDSVRSSILAEMTKNDTNGETAKIVNRLMGGK